METFESYFELCICLQKETQTCKEYASARPIKSCRGLQRREKYLSAVSALSMYSRLCMKMSSFLFVRTWAMPETLYLSCEIPF